VHPIRQRKIHFFKEIGEIWRVGVVNLVLLACVLRVTTKKGRHFFEQEKCTSGENPGYAYEQTTSCED